jgi:hypothetical protein
LLGSPREGTVAAMEASATSSPAKRFPLEVAAVWLLFAVVAVEILVTYSRIPARELYHVSGSGLRGGTSRALVFSNFPMALVSIPILALLAERLPGLAPKLVALIGSALSAAVFWPGVVSQANLDAKPVNVVAGLGVLTAVSLTVFAATRLRRPARPSRQPGDLIRAVLALLAFVVGLPWMAADLGFFLNGVPVLGSLFQSGQYSHHPFRLPPFPPAVHHGHHHGMDGILLVLSVLLLSRAVVWVRAGWLRAAVSAYLALMFCYGIGNIANDFWLEQIVKRGWTSWKIPNVLEPRVTVAWGVIVLSAVILWAIFMWRAPRRPGQDASPRRRQPHEQAGLQ